MRCDVAVVGAGIIGVTIAREVARRAPGASLVVIDRDLVGSGASRRSAGLHFPRGATPRVREMAAYSHDFYQSLLAADPALPIFPVRLRLLAAAGSAAAVAGAYLDRAVLTRQDDGGSILGGLVEVPPDVAVWRGAGCQYADVAALTEALVRELRPRVAFREGVAVTGVAPSELTLNTGETMHAGRIVLAPGPWLSAPAWRDLLTPLAVRVKKIVALHVERRPEPDDELVVFHDEDAFLLPRHDRGHWLFSYTCREWDVDPDALTAGVSHGDLTEARTALYRWARQLTPYAVGGRVFCDAYSENREPLIREVAPGVFFAGGANGSGYRLAPAIAAETGDLLGLDRLGSTPASAGSTA